MGRAARVLLVGLLAAVALFVAADRVGLLVAERLSADTLQSSEHLRNRPDVQIHGFPFLTQLMTGDYPDVTVTATDVPVGAPRSPLAVSRLAVTLRSLSVSADFRRLRAGTATADALIGYAELGRALGVRLGYAGDGRVRAVSVVRTAGRAVSGTITARPALANRALVFTGITVTGGGLADLPTGALGQVFALTVPLTGMPFRVHPQRLRVDRAGVTVTFAGRDLTYGP